MSDFFSDEITPRDDISDLTGFNGRTLLAGGFIGRRLLGLDSTDVSVTIPIETDASGRYPGIRREDVVEAMGNLTGTTLLQTGEVTDTKILTVVEGQPKFESAVAAKVRSYEEATLTDWMSYLAGRPVAVTDGEKQVLKERKFGLFAKDVALSSLSTAIRVARRERNGNFLYKNIVTDSPIYYDTRESRNI